LKDTPRLDSFFHDSSSLVRKTHPSTVRASDTLTGSFVTYLLAFSYEQEQPQFCCFSTQDVIIECMNVLICCQQNSAK